MFLNSLELNGFKSFAKKTLLEFPAGITAIIGPNGSGKSNVIDAIRWLLGEREVKNLRGTKTEDLIFNGNPIRPRSGMAQAGLCFDNSSGFFPIDFKEVTVVRRIGRDGDSKYFLNKAEVKLKDIIEFFNRSRLGTKGLVIINQGNSDVFVKALPEARRVMIEEILGLKEYQNKRLEAERKLKNTFFNMEKVKAMTEEVVPRLRMLKRQTVKWEKRFVIEKELKDLEDNYFSFRLKEIDSANLESEPKLKLLTEELGNKEKELAKLESEIKKTESRLGGQDELKDLKRRRQELLGNRSEIQKDLGGLEARLEIMTAGKKEEKIFRNEELLELIRDIKLTLMDGLNSSDSEKFRHLMKNLIEKIDNFLGRKDEEGNRQIKDIVALEETKNKLTEKFKDIENELNSLEETETKITTGLEEFNKNFRKSFELVEKKRGEIRELEDKRNKINFEKERLNLKLHDLENEIRQIGRKKDEFNFVSVKSFSESELGEMERRMFKLRTELASIGEIDESLVKETQEVENHFNFLKNQSEDLEKAAGDLKDIIKELRDKIHSEFNGSLRLINDEFNRFFKLMFKGGSAKLKLQTRAPRPLVIEEAEGEEKQESVPVYNEDNNEEELTGIEIELNLPQKRITSLDILSGGEKSLVSIAALFALISVSPPPFLVLDEIDATLDENNSRRLADLIKKSAEKTQFVIVTHNRSLMEVAQVLYGITIGDDGSSKVLSLKLEA